MRKRSRSRSTRKILANKGGGRYYYKYNDLRSATPRDFLLSERTGATFAGGKRTRNRRTYRSKRGGKKTKRRRQKQRGGLGITGQNTIIPQDIVNVGRSAMFDVGSVYNSFRGSTNSPSPLPTQDQLGNPNAYSFRYKPVDLPGIRANAEAKVGKL